jgi:hypothetical protein
VQQDFIRSIKGFENVDIVRPGYAIVGNGVSPGCFCNTLKSIVRPSSLGGVPVFNRPTPKTN